MKKEIAKFVLILVLSLLLTSCESEISKILSNPCQAPCWRNIEPGKTTLKESETIIRGFTDIKGSDIGYGGENGIFNGSTLFELNNGITIRVSYINDIVALIRFMKPKGITTFEKCVHEFGVPKYIGKSFRYGPGLPIGATSDIHPWVFVIVPENGVVFSYDSYKFFSDDQILSSSTKISTITFYDVNLFSQLLENGEIIRTDGAERLSEDDLYEWNGYGDIEELYPKR